MKNKIVSGGVPLVPFPFDDLTDSKVRPALCLTDAISNYDHIVISFITSQLPKANEQTDLPVLITDKDLKQTGLKVDSAIRLHRLVTIPKYLIQRQLGVLPSSYQTVLNQKLKDLFEL